MRKKAFDELYERYIQLHKEVDRSKKRWEEFMVEAQRLRRSIVKSFQRCLEDTQ